MFKHRYLRIRNRLFKIILIFLLLGCKEEDFKTEYNLVWYGKNYRTKKEYRDNYKDTLLKIEMFDTDSLKTKNGILIRYVNKKLILKDTISLFKTNSSMAEILKIGRDSIYHKIFF